MNLTQCKEYIYNKKIAVLGIGVSNTPLIKFLYKMGGEITAFDKAEPEIIKDRMNELKDCDIEYSLGYDYLDRLKGFDLIFKTPVIRPDIQPILEELKRGAVLSSEMELFFELCPAGIYAVTGSDGKTTTSTLMHEMLKQEGFKCWLGGNIGTPLLDMVGEIGEKDKVVLELSSFQLLTMKKSPQTAVITNITPNHLDIHKSMDEYVGAKKNIFKYQTKNNRLILNYDNKITREFAGETTGKEIFFSRREVLARGMYLDGEKMVYSDGKGSTEIMDTGIIILPGKHNIENYLAASAAVMDCVSAESIKKVASSFRGVEHRIEPVAKINEIRFYNDSIATSPNRTIAGLKSFNQKVILIAGGKDKKNNYENLAKAMVGRIKCLVLLGETSVKIEKALKDETYASGKGTDIQVINSESLEDAVNNAYLFAKPGDIIILSPASTSFDMFKDFAERGKKFKEIVLELGK